MRQIIYKGKTIYCSTTVPYPPEIIKQMKQAGYKVKEVEDDAKTGKQAYKNKILSGT